MKNKLIIEQFAIKIVKKLLNNGWTVYLYPTTKSDLDYMLNQIGLNKFKGIVVYKNYKNLNASLNFLESLKSSIDATFLWYSKANTSFFLFVMR